MIYGHIRQRDKLLSLFNQDKLAHALLLVGPASIGKRQVARELARIILCRENPQQQTAFDANTHPDYYLLDGAEKPSVEDVRTMLTHLSLKPLMAPARVAVIDNAENLSLAVQNTLLKTLEEPRSKSYFFLVSANPARLATTIRSRCQTWFFDELAEQELQQVMESLGKPIQQLQLNSLLGKTVDQAVQAYEQAKNGSDSEAAELRHTLEQLLSGDSSLALSFASAIAQNKEHSGDTIRQLLSLARNMLHTRPEQATQYRLSLFINNCISALELIENRNLAVLPVASMILLELTKPFSPKQRQVNFGTLPIILS